MAEQCSLDETKEILYEIIDTYSAILKGSNKEIAIKAKKCIRRFRDAYLQGYKLSGSYARVRIKGRLTVGYVCSSEESFPFTEAVWRKLHNYRLANSIEYFEDHPEEIDAFRETEKKCIKEIKNALSQKPIEECRSLEHVKLAFDMMVNLAHSIFSFDAETSFNPELKWFETNPWKLPRGKSMLIDYWYNIPLKLRPIGHAVLEKLASHKIETVENLLELRREVEEWTPSVDKGSS